ncbi:MAG: hypothetical protein ACJATT_001024 [Myxococcota bacterium]|jgi:hypothetical protein
MRPLFPLALLLALTGCPDKPDDSDTDSGSDTDTTGDTDPGTDPDTDTDTDSDTDTDADSGFATCGPEIVTSLPHTVSGQNFLEDYPNDGDFSLNGEGGCQRAAGPEAAFQVSLVANEILAVTVGGGELSGVIHIKDVCDTATECLASIDQDLDGRLEFTAPATGDYMVIVESFNANPVDAYTISMGIAAAEICDDGADNDIDGLTDCEDLDQCFNTVECPFECPGGLLDTFPFNARGADFTVDFPNTWAYGAADGCVASPGAEATYEVDMTAGQTITVNEVGGITLNLHVTSDCLPGTECLDSVSDFGSDRVDFTAPADGVYAFILEATSLTPFNRGYNINIGEFSEEVCDDGIDNDLNGASDCDDIEACFNTDACPFSCPTEDAGHVPLVFIGNTATVTAAVFDELATPIGPYAEGEGCSFGTGTALVYEVDMAAGNKLVVNDAGAEDIVWRVLSTCAPFDACLASTDNETPGQIYESDIDETVYLVIQGYFAESTDSLNATIQLGTTEVCGSGVDEDLDGLIDCADFDCLDTVECPFECSGLDITSDLVANGTYTASGTDFTADYPNDWDYAEGEDCGTGNGSEAIFNVDLLAGEGVRLRETASFDAVVRALNSCVPGTECIFSADFPEDQSFVASEDGTYSLIVEAWSASFAGSYEIVLDYLQPEICDNGVDDNLDGNLDCFDSGCDCAEECPLAESLPIQMSGDAFEDTFGGLRDFTIDAGCTGTNGADAVFTVSLEADQGLLIRESGPQDVVIRVLETCLTGTTCDESLGFPEELRFVAPAPGEYTVVIEQQGTGNNAFNITIDTFDLEDCPDGPGQTLDGIDNDLDGAIDCFDSDCYDPINCPVECGADEFEPVLVSGTDFVSDFPNAVDYGLGDGCGTGNGPEVRYQFELDAGETLRVAELGGLDAVVRILDDCAPGSACLASFDFPETLDFVAPADGMYTVVVESWSATPFARDYSVSVGVLESEICDDGIDNDIDGAIDCGDEDCFGAVGLCDVELNCFDGLDEDADGAEGCDDSDCTNVLGCGGSGSIVLSQSFDTWPLVDWVIDDGGTVSAGNYAAFEECVAPGAGDTCGDNLDAAGLAGTSGSFAFIDSDFPGVGTTSDDSVVSPEFSLEGYTEALVTFYSAYNDIGTGDSATVEISTDGGANWIELASMADDVAGAVVLVGLSDYAGQSGLQLRWHYISGWDWWWAIDDISVEAL